MKRGNFWIFSFHVRYSTLIHMPLGLTQFCCDFGIDSQTLHPHTRLDLRYYV
jgi:hypothetical protein